MIWWMVLGSLIGFGIATVLFLLQKSPPTKIVEVVKEDTAKLQTLEAQASQEIEKLRKKLQEAFEKCESYKKLVDIHLFEIDKIKSEKQLASDELLAKTRRIAELELYLEEPKAFPHADRENEFLYNQLKLQFEEKEAMLEQTLAHLLSSESRLKELEERTHEPTPTEITLSHQISQLASDKERLESELTSVQEIVTQLTQKKSAGKTKNKKK